MIGVYEFDVFRAASQSKDGFLEVDFLAGTATKTQITSDLADAIRRYRDALPELCQRHQGDVDFIKEFSVRYYAGAGGCRFTVKVVDKHGRSSTTDYSGLPGRRVRLMDELGRVRRKPVVRSRELPLPQI